MIAGIAIRNHSGTGANCSPVALTSIIPVAQAFARRETSPRSRQRRMCGPYAR